MGERSRKRTAGEGPWLDATVVGLAGVRARPGNVDRARDCAIGQVMVAASTTRTVDGRRRLRQRRMACGGRCAAAATGGTAVAGRATRPRRPAGPDRPGGAPARRPGVGAAGSGGRPRPAAAARATGPGVTTRRSIPTSRAAWVWAAWTSRPAKIKLCAMVGTSHDWGTRSEAHPRTGRSPHTSCAGCRPVNVSTGPPLHRV